MSIEYPIEQVRNIGVIAHIDAGKTTITERILFYSGRTHRLGDVDEGTTVTDWMEQERERGITITAAAITTTWQDSLTGAQAQINLIDTPGHIDFTAEVQRSLRVLDGGVVVFDAVAGVEPQSETVWRQADQYQVPRICFINKMDRVGAGFQRAVRMIREQLRANPLPVQLPVGAEEQFCGVIDLFAMKMLTFTDEPGAEPRVEDVPAGLLGPARAARAEMVERIVETDEGLTRKYLEGAKIAASELLDALRRAVIANRLVPVLAGSGLRNKGIQPLLDAVVRYLPSPVDIPQVEGTDPRTGGRITRRADPGESFCALVFKVVSDPFVGRLVYVRVYSGTLVAGSTVYNAGRRSQERVSRLLQMYAAKREDVRACDAGDIAAVVGLKQSFTGDTLCHPDQPILLEAIEFPRPVIRVAVAPRTDVDQDRLMKALRKLAEEDPTFEVAYDEETSETVISGMGELHLEIIVDRLRREFNVHCDVGLPQVAYRETVARPAQAEGRYIHQSGGHGQYGVVWLEVAPSEPGAGFVFENRTTGETIPQQYVPAIERGVAQTMEAGILAAYPMVDIRVTVIGGKAHAVDSSKMAFEIAASMAFREACQGADLVLLEPVMRVETRAPEEYLGSIVGDFSARRGRVEGIEQLAPGTYAIRAQAPLAEMLGYITQLRSLTTGRGTFTMEFDRYEPVPSPIADEIVRERSALLTRRRVTW